MKIKYNSIKPKIIWIGPYIPIKSTTSWIAASPAASKWQKHLLESLVQENIDVEWIYYRPDSYWPKGRLFPSKEYISSDISFNSIQIDYLNFFGLRNFTIKFFLKKILEKLKSQSNKSDPLILISYNGPKWIKDIFSDIEISSKFKKIYVVADNELDDNADGYVFLSYDYFKKFKTKKHKLHLDGGIYHNNKNKIIKKKIFKDKKIFLYSGSFHRWGDANMLLETIKYIKNQNFEIWFSGPGNAKNFELAAKKDFRIKYLGLVSDKMLLKLYQEADVFLNPRPKNMYGNQFNFPSKLLDYLAWNKPIISTWSNSLSPFYKKILHITNDDPKHFALAMKKYLDKKKTFKIKNKNLTFNKSWKNESKKLISFIKKLNLKNEN